MARPDWLNFAVSQESLTGDDVGFSEDGYELLGAPTWSDGSTLSRVLLWWDATWFTPFVQGAGPLQPPLMFFEVDVVDTEAETPAHAQGNLAIGLMSTAATAAVTQDVGNDAFDAFRVHQGNSGGQAIDVQGKRATGDFVGPAALRIRLKALNLVDSPEGWHANARFAAFLYGAFLLTTPPA